MKTHLYKLAYTVLILVGVAACNPTADEILNDQLATLDTSEFISFLASIQDDKGEPIAGATVTLETLGDSATATLTATSDANGKAMFANVPSGGHLLTIEAEGHLTASGIADFIWREGYNYTVTNELVVGIPVTESAIIPLYPTEPNTENAATIKGTVVVESNLTNTAPEAVDGITIAADLSSLVSVSSDGMSIRGYQFRGHSSFGCATTDANGDYTMMVPASKYGSFISLLFPEIELNQTVVATEQNSVPFAAPQALQIPTTFGPEVYYSATIPNVSGVTATFPAPPASGAGFTLSNFTMIPRDWSAFFNVSDTQEMPVAGDGVHVQVTSWGEGYEFSPTVEVDDANSDVTISVDADLAVGISGYNLTSTITGLTPNDEVFVSLFYEDEFGFANFVNSIPVSTDGSGAITQSLLTAGIDAAIADEEDGFGTNVFKTNEVVDSIYMVFPGTGGDGTVISTSRVHRLSFGGFGTDYINPTHTITGGSPNTALSFTLTFGSNWSFELDNSGISEGYVILPTIEYEYLEVASGQSNIDYFTSSSVTNPNTESGGVFSTFLEVNGSGEIALKSLQSGSQLLYTSVVSIEQPRVLVENVKHEMASASVSVSTDGEVTGLSISNTGIGYDDKFEVTIAPTVASLPGSGAEVTLVGGEYNNQEFEWFGGFRVPNCGANYARFANQILSYDYRTQFTTSGQYQGFEVQAGETIVRDVNYGTGRQSIDIN